MKRVRAHWRRDEMLAPWIAMAIILGGWGLAARWISPEARRALAPEPAAPVAFVSSPGLPPPALAPAPALVEGDDSRMLQSDEPPRAPEVSPLPSAPLDEHAEITALRARELTMPVQGVERKALVPSFADRRGSSRTHEALDILAPSGTPVVAVEAGTIVKLFSSKQGGITIYQFGPSGAYCYYYAHLDAYADGLAEGQPVERGQTIGYVGTTGNAPPGTPHLHFAIFRLGPDRHWWEGEAIDPYLVLR